MMASGLWAPSAGLRSSSRPLRSPSTMRCLRRSSTDSGRARFTGLSLEPVLEQRDIGLERIEARTAAVVDQIERRA